jgi:peptide subunit release factor 1 (eRF1)
MADPLAFRPQPDDTRYELRVKARIAQAHAQLAEAGVYDHALAALAELAMGKTLKGERIANVHARTRVQAAAAFFRIAGMVVPKSTSGDGEQHAQADAVDDEVYL